MGNQVCCRRDTAEEDEAALLSNPAVISGTLAEPSGQTSDTTPAYFARKMRQESACKAAELRSLASAGSTCFCCGTIEAAGGDLQMLVDAVEPMHKDAAARLFGKMMLSASASKLAAVAYVPEELQTALSSAVWLAELLECFGGRMELSRPHLCGCVVHGCGKTLLPEMLHQSKVTAHQGCSSLRGHLAAQEAPSSLVSKAASVCMTLSVPRCAWRRADSGHVRWHWERIHGRMLPSL